MKKFMFIAAILSAAVCASCSKNEIQDSLSKETMTFTASHDNMTKALLDAGFSVRWEAGDAISVFGSSGTNTRMDDPSVSDDGKSASFTGEVEVSPAYYAVYPAQDDASLLSDIITAEIPAVQTATAGSFGPDAGLAVSKCGSDRNFVFKQAGSLLGITINNDGITTVTLYSDKAMSGTARIDWNSGKPVASILKGRQSVSLTGSFIKGSTYWFTVFPGTYKGLQIVLTRSDGKTASYKNPDMVIEAGRAEAERIADITVSDSKWTDPLLADVVRVTNSTATVAWTEKASNSAVLTHIWPKSISGKGEGQYDYSGDITHEYTVSLYRDMECTELEVEHTLASSDKLFTADYPTRFCFTALQADATYWFMVTDNTNDLVLAAPLEVHTASKSFTGTVASENNAAAGDVILYESFDKLLWGGDLTSFAAGYGVADENFSTAAMIDDAYAYGSEPYAVPVLPIVKVRGNNSIAGESAKQIGLFYVNGFRALLGEAGLSGWGYTASNNTAQTTTSITALPGYLRIGASDSVIYGIASPRLSAIPNGYSADVKVHFKAAPYTTPAAKTAKGINVSIIRGGGMSSYLITGHSIIDSETVHVDGDGPEWKEYSAELSGVTGKSRVHFAAADADTAPMFMLDDIRVEITSLTREGYVKDNTGAPIEGVCVTDGFSVAQTDDSGHYSLSVNDAAEFIYLSVPAEYEIPYNSKGYPAFYKRVDESLDLDFTLEPITRQTDWTLLVATDVHANGSHTGSSRNYAMLKNKVLPDIKAAVASYSNVYSVLLGDTMTASSDTEWGEVYDVLKYANSGARFFNVPGNHDWWDSDSESATPTISQFTKRWGPTRWSFNRGDVHVVGMNNIRTSGHQMKENRELNGGNNDYQAGFTDEEFAWLKADLAAVPKDKFVVLCVHVPFGEGDNNSETRTRHVYYHDETLALLSEFAGCRIFSGHSHVNARYNDSDYKKVHESVHVAMMGNSQYHTQTCADGSPIGYQFYQFSGAALSNARFKAVGHDYDYQMRVYDGNASISGTHFGEYGWKLDKGYLVANVFFYNRAKEDDIKVELYQNGEKCCDMDRNAAISKDYTNNYIPLLGGKGATVSVVLNRDWWLWNQLCEEKSGKNNKNGNAFKSKYDDESGAWLSTSEHTYRGKLKSVPANIADADFEVRVTDAYGNVYSCTELTPMNGEASSLVFWP